MIGTTLLNRYRIEAQLGQGGMGIVYRAHDTLLNRPTAIKVLNASGLGTAGRTRLLAEARAAARLNHPNIVTVYDASEAEGQPFIVMELVEGETLRAYQPQTLDESLLLARQICLALQHAHAAGIIHRDLKPENIILTKTQTPKLMDFGLARTADMPRLTEEGAILGTMSYLAPELIEGQPASIQSDLYALGVVLYELTAGSPPFKGDTIIAVLSQHLHAVASPPSTYNAEIPAWLDGVILRLLSKQPESRPASAEELLKLLAEQRPGETRHTLSRPTNNLPAHLSTFIGREKEIAQVAARLAESHLVTLVGPGGIGKTRLSLRVAQQLLSAYPNGVWLVELAPLTDPALAPQAIVTALELQFDASRPVLAALTDYLRDRTLLLVLDNCEHMIDACAQLAEHLLRHCPQVRLLASSREALGIEGEIPFRVPSLSLPEAQQSSPEALQQAEAVQLFVERATAALPGFVLTAANAPAIVQVCRRLDGIALAIELAAVRVKLLKVEQIAARLDDAFRLLTGGSRTALPRQQTLRATIEWSYTLLSEAESRLLRCLSVFAGGWTLEAAEAVCAGDGLDEYEVLEGLTQLANKSLVMVEREQGVEARYRLLETVRQYAREKLSESGESEPRRGRHLNYFLKVAEQAELGLIGPGQATWLRRLDAELDNLRAALEWSLASDPSAGPGETVQAGLRLASALMLYWEARSLSEGSEWLSRLLDQPAASARTSARAKALTVLSHLNMFQTLHAKAQSLAEAGLALYRELGDQSGIAFALLTLAKSLWFQDDKAGGTALLAESLALYKTIGDKFGISEVLNLLGHFVDMQDYQRQRALQEESLALCRELGHIAGISERLNHLGIFATWHGDYASAYSWLTEALEFQRGLSRLHFAHGLEALGRLSLRQGDYGQAQTYLEECLSLSRESGNTHFFLWSLVLLGYVALRQGHHPAAYAIFTESLQGFKEARMKGGVNFTLEGLASLAVAQGRPEPAVRLFGWSDALRQTINVSRPPVEQEDVDRDFSLIRAQLDEATIEAAYAEGQAMTMDQAIAYGLAETQSG